MGRQQKGRYGAMRQQQQRRRTAAAGAARSPCAPSLPPACSHRPSGAHLCHVDVDVVHAVPHLRAQPLRARHLR